MPAQMTPQTEKQTLVDRLCQLAGGDGLRSIFEEASLETLRAHVARAEHSAELVRKYGRMGAEARDETW